jgi:hypothetical protein
MVSFWFWPLFTKYSADKSEYVRVSVPSIQIKGEKQLQFVSTPNVVDISRHDKAVRTFPGHELVIWQSASNIRHIRLECVTDDGCKAIWQSTSKGITIEKE